MQTPGALPSLCSNVQGWRRGLRAAGVAALLASAGTGIAAGADSVVPAARAAEATLQGRVFNQATGAALEGATKMPVAETARMFLDQPGTPLVGITVQCSKGQPAKLAMTQRRAVPAGSDAPQGEPWTVPMCIRSVIDGKSHRECFVLAGAEGSHTLAQPGCPTWIHGNDDQRGYYQWQTTPAGMLALAAEHYEGLGEAERVALPGIYRGLLEAGEMPVGVSLDALGLLARRTQRLVIEGVVDGLGLLYQSAVVQTPSLGEPFAAVVRGLLGPHVARIGALPKAGEPVDARLLRPRLVTPLAYLGRDAGLRKVAREKSDAWLDGEADLDGETLTMVLPIAAWEGDAAFWDRLRKALDDSPDPIERVALVGALGSFRDPTLLTQSLELIVDGTLLAQDFRTLMSGVDHRTQDAAWMWMTRNYRKLAERLGDSARPRLPSVGAGFCTAEDADRVQRFFAEPAHAPEGTERNLGLVIEKITRCARLRERVGAGLTERLTTGGKSAR